MTDRANNALDELLSRWDAERTSTKETKMSATDQRQRATLISSGEHIYALRRLGKPSYSAEEYLEAVERSRDAGDGQAYADAALGPDPDLALTGEADPDELIKAVEADLRSHRIEPDQATYQQYADALARVSP
jgi:hypothetical protein